MAGPVPCLLSELFVSRRNRIEKGTKQAGSKQEEDTPEIIPLFKHAAAKKSRKNSCLKN